MQHAHPSSPMPTHVEMSEDALLLREFAHRTGNEVAAALAAIHLHRRAKGTRAKQRLLDDAVARLEHFGDVNRMLAAPVRGLVDASAMIDALVRGLVGGRGRLVCSRVILQLPPLVVDAAVARRMALITSEVVGNALTHALADRPGILKVALDGEDDMLRLRVEDDGPGIRPGAKATGTGWGRGIVLELAGRGGGTVDVATSAVGTVVTVSLPRGDGMSDENLPF